MIFGRGRHAEAVYLKMPRGTGASTGEDDRAIVPMAVVPVVSAAEELGGLVADDLAYCSASVQTDPRAAAVGDRGAGNRRRSLARSWVLRGNSELKLC